jgi:membrane protein
VSIALALWSASNYVAAFMRASTSIYDVPEGRPIWKTAPIRLGVTVVTMILLVAASVIVVVTGGLAQKAGNVLGVGSAAFAVYIANFSHYNKIYGSLASVIIFLIWMWISNVAILLGAEFNAELERGRAVAGGHPPDQEPFSELRDDRKLRKRKKEGQPRR